MKTPAFFLSLLLAVAVAGCANDIKPKSIEGECRLFRDPGFAVQGKTREDQRWISTTQETGIRVCDWKRPPRVE